MQLEPVHSMDAVFGATPWEPSYEESHVCPCPRLSSFKALKAELEPQGLSHVNRIQQCEAIHVNLK